jgi:hypothetical protein
LRDGSAIARKSLVAAMNEVPPAADAVKESDAMIK